jgi:hypothetical protein
MTHIGRRFAISIHTTRVVYRQHHPTGRLTDQARPDRETHGSILEIVIWCTNAWLSVLDEVGDP